MTGLVYLNGAHCARGVANSIGNYYRFITLEGQLNTIKSNLKKGFVFVFCYLSFNPIIRLTKFLYIISFSKALN